ncbi:hypothetical protein ACO1O0_006978 [Amphichorda felina]
MSEQGTAGWKWFPSLKEDWSLDVVNLLVVIGEQSMIEHAQPITASLLCVLPRIIPAPQVFLKATRPTRLPEVSAKMTGVYSGTTLESVGFFANIITPLDEQPAFGFKVLDIRHSDKCHAEDNQALRKAKSGGGGRGRFMRALGIGSKDKGRKSLPTGPPRDEESIAQHDDHAAADPAVRDFAASGNGKTSASATGNDHHDIKPIERRKTARETVQDILSHPTMAVKGQRPAVPAHLFSPVHILGVLSFFLSIAIVACAIAWEDGNAVIAITLISFVSTIVGVASFWRPLLMSRRHTNEVPKGDVMIRTREGAFLLIRCTEDVARELYSGTDECQYYVTGRTYRLLMALGTVLVMLTVVLLGNCTWNMQVFIGGSYIVLNGLYWGLGMLPRHYFWDLSRYTWVDATLPDAQGADVITDEDDQREGHPSFTRTLWYAIRETQRTGWVQISGAAPGTDQWKQWLAEAERNAREGNRGWNAVERKNAIMNGRDKGNDDQAMNCAPATQVGHQGDQGQTTSSL